MQDAGVIKRVDDADDKRLDTPWQLHEDIDATRFATVFGSGIGGMQIFTDEAIKLHEKGAKRVNPLFIPSMISNIAAGELAIRYGLQGECTNSVVACTTGTQCIGEAYRLIKFGIADAALAGGAEESLCDISIAGFANLGALSHAEDPKLASRPFDAGRNGFVAGEGSGAVVLESLDHALARGAHIYGEVVGFGTSCDAHHVTSPDPAGTGVARAMRIALEDAGATPAEIGHLNAHGTSTQLNDATESAALNIVCEGYDVDVPVTSTKGITGHMLGAAGAVEAIVTTMSLENDLVPPTAGFETPSEDCQVTVLKEARKGVHQKLALSNSIGFGGHNATLAIATYKD
jgi:3-oxoacyl-[acyl-carrier-protein] synthase II